MMGCFLSLVDTFRIYAVLRMLALCQSNWHQYILNFQVNQMGIIHCPVSLLDDEQDNLEDEVNSLVGKLRDKVNEPGAPSRYWC